MHQYVEDGEQLSKFYHMYENLPPGHMDLATRWNDLSQTLLYRYTRAFPYTIVCLSEVFSYCKSVYW